MSDIYTKLYPVRTNSYYSDSAVFKMMYHQKEPSFYKSEKSIMPST